MCFFCSTLFVKLIQGDTLGEAAGTCVHPLGHVWCQPVAWAVLCQLRSLPETTYQLKYKPFLFLFAPAELTRMGTQPGSSKELMPPSLGNRSGWPPACCPSQEVPAELSSCCPQQQPWSFTLIWCLLPCPIAVFPSYFPGSPPQKRPLHLGAGPCGQPHPQENPL